MKNTMKVLLFTHKNDIDGVGNAVLAKLAFSEVEYVLCETFDLNSAITKYLNNGKVYDFDRIFVTDLCPNDETLTKITNDDKLKDKFFVFDHHKTSLNSAFCNEPFLTVKISNDTGLCCATSLFFKYLKSLDLLSYCKALDSFVELTRRHDTWEWKNIYNDEASRELSILFDTVSENKYIDLMVQKIKIYSEFYFSTLERSLIDTRIELINKKLVEYANNIQYKEILGLKAGILFIEYSYRNEIAEYFRENHFDMDFVMFIAMDRKTVSYRTIKDGVNVRKVAEYFGGKGHDKAATNPISDEKFQSIIEILTNL